MSGKNKEAMFAKLVAQQAKPVAEEEAAAPEIPAADTPPSPALPVPARPKRSGSKPEPVTAKGKRDNPDYCQANAYVPKRIRKAVDRQLLDIEGLDYSTLIEDLLRKWLKARGVSE